MLVHLSNTSPYVCDLNRGPIEQANRMASAPTKKVIALLEQKESFPKQTRTPLKLLTSDEVPMDSTIPINDINASLQPVWYTEQTIVDDHHVQQEDIASIIKQQQGKSLLPQTILTHSTLSPIESESPSFADEEEEELPNQPSLMHKSSTFTIEPSINIDIPLNDSEKENLVKEDINNQLLTSSDDSFRALERLLGLGSTATVRESPKTNHDTLSLTVVTPTDIINSTTTSSRMSYTLKGTSDSLPSSQDIPTMPTIESNTSTNPPSFLIDNTAIEEEEQPLTTINQQTSVDITDNDTIKDGTNNDDETNFSFELNDFPDTSKNESIANVSVPSPPMITIRAPTCADVAYRALIKPRTGGRISQPVKADSPLAKSNKLRSSAPTSRILRSSCRRISTDSSLQNSIIQEQPSSIIECSIDETKTNIEPQMKLVEIVSVPEEDENEQEKTTSVTLNLTSPKETDETDQNTSIQLEQPSTPTKSLKPLLSREYTYNTPKRRPSERRRSMLNSSHAIQIPQHQTTINEEESTSPSIPSKSMLEVLLTNPTENESNILQKTLTTTTTTDAIASSPVRLSTKRTTNKEILNSPSIPSKSMLEVLLTNPTENESNILQKTLTTTTTTDTIASSPVRFSTKRTTNKEILNSPSIPSKSMLEVLLTNPTENEPNISQTTLTTTTTTDTIALSPVRLSTKLTTDKEAINSPSIPSKSMLEVLLTNPTETNSDALQKTLTTSIIPSPVRTSIRTTRKSERLSSNPTPRVSINPLHSSTPSSSSSKHKSLQMVSIGEEEQLSTVVPQQINIDLQEEEEEEQQVEMVPLNDIEESIQQPTTIRTIEIGIQTTPSVDVLSRRRLNTMEQQTTPIVQMNKSSSFVIVNEQEEITPLQTKAVMDLKRNVRFQLTPTTDARLVAKEKFEENLRGLKPDIVVNPPTVILETKQESVKPIKTAPIKKVSKSKTKVITSKKRKVTSTKKTKLEQQPTEIKSRQPRKAAQKEKPTKQQDPNSPTKGSKKKSEVIPPTKRTQRKQPIVEATTPVKRVPRKRTIPEVTTNLIEPIVEATSKAKRVPRKRTIPEVTTKPIVEAPSSAKRVPRKRTTPEVTTNSIEPIAKRIKTSKSVEAKRKPVEVLSSSLNLPRTRSRSANNAMNVSKPMEQQPKTKIEPDNNISMVKRNKRRLQSVEKNEELNKKVKQENIQPVSLIQNFELSEDERQKIESLTVASLKSRLNAHNEDIPKGAKKIDLIALLVKIETNLLKERKEAEAATVNTTAKTTRRRKK